MNSALWEAVKCSCHSPVRPDLRCDLLPPAPLDFIVEKLGRVLSKANEGTLGILAGFSSVKSTGGDIVLVANAPEGQVIHYLMGHFGTMIESKQPLRSITPPSVKHLIVFTEYPDLAGRRYYEQSDKVMFMQRWDDVLQALRKFHGDKAQVAVYPHAEVQYCK